MVQRVRFRRFCPSSEPGKSRDSQVCTNGPHLSLYWSDWLDQITSTPIDRSLVMRTFKTRPLQTVKYKLFNFTNRSLSFRFIRSISRSVFLVMLATGKDRLKIMNQVTHPPLVSYIVDYLITNSSREFTYK